MSAKGGRILLAATCWFAAACCVILAADDSTKEPVPSPAAVADAVKVIRTTCAQDYADRSVTGRDALAKRLLALADAPETLTVGYALLTEAQLAANEAGDWTTAGAAIDALAKTYDIPPERIRQMKLASLTSASRATRPAPGLGTACVDLAEMSVQAGDNESATKAAALAVTVAKKSGDAQLSARAAAEAARVEHAKTESVAAAAADKKLITAPDDKAANLASGKWHCFVKGEWALGLPRLARSSDAALVAAASADLAPGSEPADVINRGDLWWTYAQQQAGITARSARSRAAYWYTQAGSDLKGLVKSKVETRLAEQAAIGDMLIDGGWLSRDATYKPASVYMGQITPSPELMNGKEDGRGFAFIADGSKPWIIVDLGRPCRLSAIDIHNRKDPSAEIVARAKTLTVWLAASPIGPFKEVWTADNDPEPRWQIHFEPLLVTQFLKIGLKEPEQFHLLSLKVFGKESAAGK